MPKANSSRISKPIKPYPAFPLFPHASRRWAKKIRGKTHYFGSWEDGHEAALERYDKTKEALHAGLTPVDTRDGLTVRNLIIQFLAFKKSRRDAGAISPRTLEDYGRTCSKLVSVLGRDRFVADLTPADFAKLLKSMEKSWGPVRVGAELTKSKTVFNFAFQQGLIERTPVYGMGFKKPSAKTLRIHRAATGPKLFSAIDIRRLIEAAGQPLKTMILLGINAGFGNIDVKSLPLAAIDLESGWLDFARVKTGVARRVPLWPETVAAVREWIPERPEPKDPKHDGLLFTTAPGNSWVKKKMDCPLSKEFRKLADGLNIKGAYYWLRHTFQTQGDDARDFIAVRKIMAHVSDDIADAYRERISDERLIAVTDHVRAWLFDGGF